MEVETLPRITRLGTGNDALLRCGCAEYVAGITQLGFVTPQYALVWVQSGTGVYRDRHGRRWRVEPGSAFQRWPHQPHDLLCAGHQRWWYLAVPAAAWEALTQVSLPTQRVPVLTVGRDRRLPGRITALAHRLQRAPEQGLGDCLAEMLALIVELHRRARAVAATAHAAAIDAACQAIGQDPARRWSGHALAAQVGLSYHVFRKAFAQRVGSGMQQYCMRQRLERAQDLLMRTDDAIHDVAAAVGYADPLQFSTVFRRHYGINPRRWRALGRDGARGMPALAASPRSDLADDPVGIPASRGEVVRGVSDPSTSSSSASRSSRTR